MRPNFASDHKIINKISNNITNSRFITMDMITDSLQIQKAYEISHIIYYMKYVLNTLKILFIKSFKCCILIFKEVFENYCKK